MTIDRKFVKSLPNGPQKKHYTQILKDYMANDEWAKKALEQTCVLITSHPGNRSFLTSCVETHSKLGLWTILVYDNYWNPNDKSISYDALMPKRKIFDAVHTFLIPNYQTWGGVLYPYFWLLKFGFHTASCFKYVYCTNGDCIIEKPENFPKLFEMLGDGDVMGCGWEKTPQGRELFNTTAFLAKTDAMQKVMKHFEDHLIPFENYEKYAEEFGNTEARFARAMRDLKLKVVQVPENPYNTQSHIPGKGTWYKTMGFRHIHGEWGYYNKKDKSKIPWEYIDQTYLKRRK